MTRGTGSEGASGAQQTVGRPRSFDESEVIDASLDVFWRRGSAGTTTRVLETELGLTQSSIYNAFGSKDALLLRSLDRYIERIDADVVSILDRPGAGVGELHRFIDSLVEWITVDGRPGCLLLNLVAEDGGADLALAERARAYRDRLRESFVAVLRNIGAPDAERIAETMLATVLGINIAARGRATSAEIDALVDGMKWLIDRAVESAGR